MEQPLSGESLKKRLQQLRHQFDEAVRAYEKNDVYSSVTSSRDIVEDVHNLLNDVTKNYQEALLANKIPFFLRDKQYINTISENRTAPPETDQYIEFLSGVDQSIRVLEKEIFRTYPRRWNPQAWVKKNLKVILTISLIILVAAGTFLFVRSQIRKKRGLVGFYYADKKFGTLHRIHRVQEIDFNWGTGSPLSRWRKDDFSIRWSGYLKIAEKGTYEFFIHSDDGVRFKIDNNPLIENWTVHRLTVDRASIYLSTGPHPITLEYFENNAKASVRLLWKKETDAQAQIIPASAMAPNRKYAE